MSPRILSLLSNSFRLHSFTHFSPARHVFNSSISEVPKPSIHLQRKYLRKIQTILRSSDDVDPILNHVHINEVSFSVKPVLLKMQIFQYSIILLITSSDLGTNLGDWTLQALATPWPGGGHGRLRGWLATPSERLAFS